MIFINRVPQSQNKKQDTNQLSNTVKVSAQKYKATNYNSHKCKK